MAKFYGVIGYGTTVETEPGIFEEKVITKEYVGDILDQARRLENGSKINSDINISNRISIISDPFANNHFHEMLYAEMAGAKWKITEVKVNYPRLVLTLGGLYNG